MFVPIERRKTQPIQYRLRRTFLWYASITVILIIYITYQCYFEHLVIEECVSSFRMISHRSEQRECMKNGETHPSSSIQILYFLNFTFSLAHPFTPSAIFVSCLHYNIPYLYVDECRCSLIFLSVSLLQPHSRIINIADRIRNIKVWVGAVFHMCVHFAVSRCSKFRITKLPTVELIWY